MQNVAELKKSTNASSVLTLKRRNLGSFAHTIYQDDLEAILIARTEIKKAVKKLEEKEEYVAAALRGGARVEAGLHTAELLRVDRKGFRVKAGIYFRLAVRLLVLSVLPLCGQAQSQPGSSAITKEIDGGSVVTELGYNLRVNDGSTLRRRWFVVGFSDCAARLDRSGIRTEYQSDRYSGSYRFTAGGKIISEKAVVAFEVRFALFDLWGNHVRTLGMTRLRDIPQNTPFDLADGAAWRASEGDVKELFNVVSFISHVRFSDGSTWNFDAKKLAAEIARLRLNAREEELAPERPGKSGESKTT